MGAVNVKETILYKKAFEQAMRIFEMSKSFPREEKYSLTDQIRRSSKSVCANLAAAYRKKKYSAHFTSKLTDCDAENSETSVWVGFTLACEYIKQTQFDKLNALNNEVGRLMHHIINNPDRY